MQDAVGFSNRSEFFYNLQIDDGNALPLISQLASTALNSHFKVFLTELLKSIRNSAGADNWGPERWSADTPSLSSLSSSDSSPLFEEDKKRYLQNFLFFQHFNTLLTLQIRLLGLKLK